MPSPSVSERFKSYAVPLVVFLIVTVTVLVVPPIVLGELTWETYAITAAIIYLAVDSVFPYAVLVALGTLPLLSAGIASFAAPEAEAEVAHSFSAVTALRHIVAGVSYVFGAAVVGAIGFGVQMAVKSSPTALPTILRPTFLYLGGLIVAGVFVCLQLWRYDTSAAALARRTILGTMSLGALLALSPAIAFWVFYDFI